jgi:N6-L-threonylcarbamoyladenine synthase
MLVLGIETSCDETAAAVVRDGRDVLSNVVFSQAARHAPFGGVVPEIASRCHVEALPAAIADALREAHIDGAELDLVAATYGPGLSSSLLTGLAAAKGLALRLGKPFGGVNHVEGHLYSAFLAPSAGPSAARTSGPAALEDHCPFLCLIVSGGHTALVRVRGLGQYTLIGQTLDDAAGEALDKAATLLGLGYPGGPAIQAAAVGGDPAAVRFPRSRPRQTARLPASLDPQACFSFSGLKTALLYHLQAHPLGAAALRRRSDVAASFQQAVVDALIDRCRRSLRGARALVVGGGVTQNASLRAALTALAREHTIPLFLPEPQYCGDNAAMIAALAGVGRGVGGHAAWGLDAHPSLELG